MAEGEKSLSGENPIWPNQQDIPDGVVPTDDVTQDPKLFEGDVDLDVEMEV